MANRFELAISRGLKRTRETLATTITYVRGNDSVELQASRLQTPFFQYNVSGVRLRLERVDFGISVADLRFDNEAIEPRDGDTIQLIEGSQTINYVVRGIDQEPCWRFSDTGRTQYRIHTEFEKIET